MDNKRGVLKASFLQAGSIKHTFKDSTCILLVSVGQPYHEGEKLLATINLINDNRFRKCDIMICDTLQRHTLGITRGDCSLEELYIDTKYSGDLWISNNKVIYSRLSMPYQIFRWDQWLKDPNYDEKRRIIDNLYENESFFREAMYSSVNEFIDRNQKKYGFDEQLFFNSCLEYLKEECSVIMPIWMKFNYNFIIYPGKMIDVIKASRIYFVEPYSNILRWLHVRFKRKNISYKL